MKSNRDDKHPFMSPRGYETRHDFEMPHFERLLDSEEAAMLLRIHPKTLQRMARNGDISGVQIGKLWRFRASVLNQWLDSKTTQEQE